MGHKTCLHFPRQKKRRKEEEKSLTSSVKAEDHCGNAASFGGICCVGGPRCAAPHGNAARRAMGGGQGSQTNPTGANATSCLLACLSRHHGQSDDWGPPGAKNNKRGGSPAPTTTTTPSGKAEEETLRIPGRAVGCLSQSHRETVHHPAVRANQSANHTLLIYIFLMITFYHYSY